uniref:Uncharacterized protein n=1 Tax=Sciurus vulgaris TaxID=55149 RepID=A0A8D2D2S7_SCIVU
ENLSLRRKEPVAHFGGLWVQVPGSLSSPGFSADLPMLDNVIHQRESPSFSSYP